MRWYLVCLELGVGTRWYVQVRWTLCSGKTSGMPSNPSQILDRRSDWQHLTANPLNLEQCTIEQVRKDGGTPNKRRCPHAARVSG